MLCIAHDKGRRHDLWLFKKSNVYKNPLTQDDKARNRAISSERVTCENVIARLKRFKIIADRYRNRRRRFGLRFFLIAALYNSEISHA